MKNVAKAVIFDAHGHVLILRRSETHPRLANELDFPGGEIEENEPHKDAIIREILEETGLVITPNDIHLVSRQKTPQDNIHVLFEAHLSKVKPSVLISWEHNHAEWMTVTELLAYPVESNTDPTYHFGTEYLQNRPIKEQ